MAPRETQTMDHEDIIDPKTTRLVDFVMEASLCGAIAAFVLLPSALFAIGVFCLVWLAGMALVEHIEA